MPALIANHRDKETVVKFKKFYSTMSQAYVSVINSYGELNEWGDTSSSKQATELAASYFKEFLLISKDCGYEAGCFPDTKYSLIDGREWGVNFLNNPIRYMVRLNDGSAVAFYTQSANFTDNSTIVIYYDVNGEKMPNIFGKDMFQIIVEGNKIKPSSANSNDILTECLREGYSCSTWILRYENLDYLHCPEYLKSNPSAGKCK